MLAALALLLVTADKPDAAQLAAKKILAAPPANPACEDCREVCPDGPLADCRALCDAGQVEACTMVASRLLREQAPDAGAGLPADVRKLLDKAVAKHESVASGMLGQRLISGQGVKRDERRGAALLGESCALEHWPACHALALAYEKGTGVPRSAALAVEHAERACARGYPLACVTAGGLRETGPTVDLARARDAYQRGCGQGSSECCAAQQRLGGAKPDAGR